MAIPVGYEIERIVWLTVYPLLTILSCLMLRQDYARIRAKKSVNIYHMRQHVMQLIANALAIIESVDGAAIFGILPPWTIGFLGGIGSSMLAWCMIIACYLLIRGHFILVSQEPGKWWIPLALLGIFFICAHTTIQTIGYYIARPSPLPFVDSVVSAFTGIVCCVIITTVFFRIRRLCLLSDRASATPTKILPQLRKMARVVALVDVIVGFIMCFILASNGLDAVFIEYPEDGSFKLTFGLLSRFLIVGLTMIWSYHPLCGSRSKDTTTASTTSLKDQQGHTAADKGRDASTTKSSREQQESPVAASLEPTLEIAVTPQAAVVSLPAKEPATAPAKEPATEPAEETAKELATAPAKESYMELP